MDTGSIKIKRRITILCDVKRFFMALKFNVFGCKLTKNKP
jgi:hypothetical protein